MRNRAGVKPLETVTFENIVHEYRVEFAFEDHRYWDMKRWRLADKVWNGNNNDPQARHRRLWPYRVVHRVTRMTASGCLWKTSCSCLRMHVISGCRIITTSSIWAGLTIILSW